MESPAVPCGAFFIPKTMMLAPITSSLALICSLFLLTGSVDQQEIYFDIKPTSKLFFKGTSNINTFSCDCENYTHSGTVRLSESPSGNWIFDNAKLSVAIASFDCGHSGINRDMGKALKSDVYPNIVISLKEIVNNPALRSLQPGTEKALHAVVDISLSGVTRQHPLNISVKEIKRDQFRITGEKTLYMTDFGVAPPTALFGLVKVNDVINISLDLELTALRR